MICLLPYPLPPSPVSKLDTQRDDLLTGEGGEGVRGGTKSYDCEKAWSSINQYAVYASVSIDIPSA